MSDPMVATEPKPSAPWVATGLVLMLLAPMMVVVGALQSLAWEPGMYDQSDPGLPLMAVGGVLSTVGAVLLTVGAFRIAQHLDRLGGVRYRHSTPAPISDDERERQAAARRSLVEGA